MRASVIRSASARYSLPQAKWSLAKLNLLSTQSPTITKQELDKLAKLSCIDLKAAGPRVSEEEICRDINIILNCANLLKVCCAEQLLPFST